jgi:endonuclease-3
VLALDPTAARRSLKKFPTIGDPGADKILLFTGTVPSLAPESNGLRVLMRLGFVKENKNYSTMYRAAQTALQDESGKGCAAWAGAHQLLKRHGQELCRRSGPRCQTCPLRKTCPFASA